MFMFTLARSALLLMSWTFVVLHAALLDDSQPEVELPCSGQCGVALEGAQQDEEEEQGLLLLHTSLAIRAGSSWDVLDELFSLFDRDHDGKVSATELGTVVHALGRDHTNEMLSEMIAHADKSGDYIALDLQEFGRLARWARTYDRDGEDPSGLKAQANFDRAFRGLDLDGNSVATPQELLEAFSMGKGGGEGGGAAGLGLTREQIDRMVHVFDTNSNAAMEKNEYFKMRLADRLVENLAHAGRRPGGGGHR